ncbi:TetR/AcrR family transcriptional regulator [Aeromicrobium camelliae]|uniref:TetR/AcrR family transcriptional regulator n=2 Tax=Aeromicrobium TaxID=2040 RepID=A0A3N6ZFU7_9ACTN|nr:TetR/AcrR family transcriptional regulator [Aeromicrobium camelliae]RQN08981.1 TetR/AcrR family transcriptional regulator [Aeromicrobium camelliae]
MTTTLTPKARAVLTAASELFYAQGIHAVGVDAIAERAGVTKKTLYDRFGSKDRLVVEYLRDRDAQWRTFLDPRIEAAGPVPAQRLAAIFDASAEWAAERGTKGCGMVNAHAEISDPDHPAYRVIVGQKQWMLRLFRELAEAAGAGDQTESLAEEILLLHEGALVAAGIGVLPDAFARARDLAVSRLAAAVR